MTVDTNEKWCATDFLIESIPVPVMDVVVAIQCSVKRVIKRPLPWHSVSNIFAFCGSDGKFVNKIPKAHIASPIGSLAPEEYKELHVSVETILEASLPMLGNLTKPALMLPGKLQAVVKAQRIYLQPGSEYTGCWHYDGKKEDIVAVVLYYYRFTEGI